MEVNDHIAINLANIVDITKDRLAHHVLSVDVKVDILHKRFLRVLICRFQLLPDRVLLQLKMIIVIDTIAQHVT